MRTYSSASLLIFLVLLESLHRTRADRMDSWDRRTRLYARLHETTITTTSMAIKTSPNCPNTKGECEHLTSEHHRDL